MRVVRVEPALIFVVRLHTKCYVRYGVQIPSVIRRTNKNEGNVVTVDHVCRMHIKYAGNRNCLCFVKKSEDVVKSVVRL